MDVERIGTNLVHHVNSFSNMGFDAKSQISSLLFQINTSSIDDGLNFYDPGHRIEHSELLLVLLRSLPYASWTLQSRALQVSFLHV